MKLFQLLDAGYGYHRQYAFSLIMQNIESLSREHQRCVLIFAGFMRIFSMSEKALYYVTVHLRT